jgi:bacillithiol synthase
MGCLSIPFRRLPHQPKLFVRLVDDFPSVSRFFAHPPTLDAVTKAARDFKFPADRRKEVAAILRRQNASLRAGPATQANLDRLEQGAVAIVSGQQVGLFGGPAYAFYKALSAIQIAQELTDAGTLAVPVFWMATEDHDLDEVRHVGWFDTGNVLRFELPANAANSSPVGRLPLGPDVNGLVAKACSLLSGPAADRLSAILQTSYRPEETYGSSFGKLFAALFAEQGLILLDPGDEKLHRLAMPVYRKAVEDRDQLNKALLDRDAELEQAGFEPQVKVTAKSTLLFSLRGGSRHVISASNDGFQSGETSWTRDELLRLVETEPESISPNALLRPVVQDYLLPTVAYLGGPAEISYFAQSQAIYSHVLGRMPVVLPRAAFTIVDPKADKLLQKYNLCIENLWAGSQELRRKMEAVSVPETLARDLDRDKDQIDQALANLSQQIAKLDATLGGSVETARAKINFHLENLRRKIGRSLDEKVGLLNEHERFLENLLYPHKTLQSRELSLLPFLARWGMDGLKELQALSGTANLKEHRIVRIP